MNVNEPKKREELEEKAIDGIARFCVLAAREIHRVEQKTGRKLISTLLENNGTERSKKFLNE